MKYFVYAIHNEINDKIYVGQTADLEKRIFRHNAVLPSKTTSFTHINLGQNMWKLIYYEEFDLRKEAVVREKQLKSFQGRKFIKTKIPSR